MSIKEQLKQSIDIRYYRKQLYLGIGLFAALTVLFTAFAAYLLHISDADYTKLLIVPIAFALPCAPGTIAALVKMCGIYRNSEKYSICKARFEDPHSGLFGLMYFTVELQINGKYIHMETNSVFPRWAFEEYLHKKALAAYDESADRVVIIKLI